MTRLDRIKKAFNDYDDMVEDLAFNNNDGSKSMELSKLRDEVRVLIDELNKHGCRRKD